MAINLWGGDNLLAGYQVRAVAERPAGTLAHKSKRSLVKIWHFHLALSPLSLASGATPAKNEGRQSAGRRWAACSHNLQGPDDTNATFPKWVCGNNWLGRIYLSATQLLQEIVGGRDFLLLLNYKSSSHLYWGWNFFTILYTTSNDFSYTNT